MEKGIPLRDFVSTDADALNRLALAAFRQYSGHYTDWEPFAERISRMDELANSAEIIVATVDGELVGAVAYVAPTAPKASFFAPEWAVLRMLIVAPAFRGRGLGRALTEECIQRARRDRAAVIALHTSPIMEVALGMYRRMGFEWVRSVAPIHGVPYGVYAKCLLEGVPAISEIPSV